MMLLLRRCWCCDESLGGEAEVMLMRMVLLLRLAAPGG
jgi:hypothetical protein